MGWTITQMEAYTLTFLLLPSCIPIVHQISANSLEKIARFSQKDYINRFPATDQRSALFLKLLLDFFGIEGYFSSKDL